MMNSTTRKRSALIAAIVGCSVAGFAAYAQGPELIGKKVLLNDKTGHVIISDALISGTGQTIIARKAEYVVDAAEAPRVIDLTDVEITSPNGGAISDQATYYPDLEIITARKITLIQPLQAPPGRFPQGLIALTCSAGTLMADGQAIGSSWCSNTPGGGSTTYSCGGAGGNYVKHFNSPMSCMNG